MTLTVDLVLLLIALGCFLFSAAGVNTGRVNLTPLGLAFVVLSVIV